MIGTGVYLDDLETDDKALERAETVREKVESELQIIHNDEWLPITISLGVAAFPDNGRSPEEVIKAADDSLYKAKEEGRNRAICA